MSLSWRRIPIALCWHADSIPPHTPPPPPQTLLSSSSFFPDSDHFRNSPSNGTVQVLINGYKRGISPKHRQKMQNSNFMWVRCPLFCLVEQHSIWITFDSRCLIRWIVRSCRPQVSKLSILRLYARVCKDVYGVEIPRLVIYDIRESELDAFSFPIVAPSRTTKPRPTSMTFRTTKAQTQTYYPLNLSLHTTRRKSFSKALQRHSALGGMRMRALLFLHHHRVSVPKTCPAREAKEQKNGLDTRDLTTKKI